jgi:hypothetical protein
LGHLALRESISLFIESPVYSFSHVSIQKTVSAPINQNIHIFVEPFTYSSKDPRVEPFIYSTNHLHIYQSKLFYLHPTIYPFIEKISRFIETSTYASNQYLFVELSTYPRTGPGAHPASYKTGTGSFPGVKRPKRGADHPTPSSAEVEGRAELYINSPLGLRGLF